MENQTNQYQMIRPKHQLNFERSQVPVAFKPETGLSKAELIAEIKRLKKEKDVLILGHYYINDDLQAVVDILGDSLVLARKAAETKAKILAVCGVHFMAETAKLLSPQKKVLMPDERSSCSLALSCDASDLKAFKDEHPDYIIVAYVNTTAAVKALTDVIVTSSNAKHIIDQLPQEAKILFVPDQNLGAYINRITGRKMVLWEGGCHVHQDFSPQKLKALKEQYPEAKVLAHPECPQAVLDQAHYVGSTSGILNYARTSEAPSFLVATEPGILCEMRKTISGKTFIPIPASTPNMEENVCEYMRMHTLESLYRCLKNESPEIVVDPAIMERAKKPILKMLAMS